MEVLNTNVEEKTDKFITLINIKKRNNLQEKNIQQTIQSRLYYDTGSNIRRQYISLYPCKITIQN